MGKETINKESFIYQEITKLFPNAHCELNYQNAIQLLIAIILSAQTTDEAVNKVTNSLFNKYKNIEDYIQVPLEVLEQKLKHLGLYKVKAKNIKAMSIQIKDFYNGEILPSQEMLESLPGVGRKTANVFLAEWYHVPRIGVDTHVKRISVRLGLADETDNPEQIEVKLMNLYHESLWIDLHHKFIFFGRYFCKAKKPNCQNCPIISVCKKPLI
ncbi:MAG: endonuclease III [Firmicutes bacterium]|nr:endonuclease III [Bacillota bacterium]